MRLVKPIFIPCYDQTPSEMVQLIRDIYRETNSKYCFEKHIVLSNDPRLSTMNNFAIDVMYEFCKEISK